MAGPLLCPGSTERAYDGLRYVPSSYPLTNPILNQTIGLVVIGKAEGMGPEWHGHVTALTVAPEYRRLSLASKMMNLLEHVSDSSYRGYFVDLYVRCTNVVAIGMYEGLGYSVYRRVREYYGSLGLGRSAKDEEDAFGECSVVGFCVGDDELMRCSLFADMRKPLSRDSGRRSIRANGREMIVSAHDVS